MIVARISKERSIYFKKLSQLRSELMYLSNIKHIVRNLKIQKK